MCKQVLQGLAAVAVALATAGLSPAQARGKVDPTSFSGHGPKMDMKVNTAWGGSSVVACSSQISTTTNPSTGVTSHSCRGPDGTIYTGTPVPRDAPAGGSGGGGKPKP